MSRRPTLALTDGDAIDYFGLKRFEAIIENGKIIYPSVEIMARSYRIDRTTFPPAETVIGVD